MASQCQNKMNNGWWIMSWIVVLPLPVNVSYVKNLVISQICAEWWNFFRIRDIIPMECLDTLLTNARWDQIRWISSLCREMLFSMHETNLVILQKQEHEQQWSGKQGQIRWKGQR